MQRIARRGISAALTLLGVAGCVDPVAPTESRSTPLPTFDVSVGSVLCKPCPPGVICAAVCEPLPEHVGVGGAETAAR
jgi:hypothetical protein